MVWRLATFTLYVSLAHQATDRFVQRKEVQMLFPKGPDGHAQDFAISNDDSQSELDSILL